MRQGTIDEGKKRLSHLLETLSNTSLWRLDMLMSTFGIAKPTVEKSNFAAAETEEAREDRIASAAVFALHSHIDKIR